MELHRNLIEGLLRMEGRAESPRRVNTDVAGYAILLAHLDIDLRELVGGGALRDPAHHDPVPPALGDP